MENLFLHVNIRGKRPFPRIVSDAAKITFPPISTCLNFHTADGFQPAAQMPRIESPESQGRRLCLLPSSLNSLHQEAPARHIWRPLTANGSTLPVSLKLAQSFLLRVIFERLLCNKHPLPQLYKCYFVSSQINYCFIRLLICSILIGGLTSHSPVEIPCYSASIRIKSLEKETVMSWQT